MENTNTGLQPTRETDNVDHVPSKGENHDKIEEVFSNKTNEKMDIEESTKENGVEMKKAENENWQRVEGTGKKKRETVDNKQRNKNLIMQSEKAHEKDSERGKHTLTWIFDKAEETPADLIRQLVTSYGGKEVQAKKLEKGGIAVTLQEEGAVATISDMKDFLAKEGFRVHVPKNMLHGSAKIFIRKMHAQSTADEIVNMITEEGTRVIDMYRILNKETGNFTGLVKVVVLGNKEVNKWIMEGRVNLGGVRRPIERERKPRTCNNCYRYGHTAEECPNGKICRKCGDKDHIAKDCTKEKVTTCGYCREEGHISRNCELRKKEEKEERIQHRKNTQMKIKTVWQQRGDLAEKKKNELSIVNIASTTETSTITNTVDTNRTNKLRKEIREEVHAAMAEMKEEQRIMVEKINKSDNETAKIIEKLKGEIREEVKAAIQEIKEGQNSVTETMESVDIKIIIKEMRNEFKEQRDKMDKEWERRMERQKVNDEEWEVRTKKQQKETLQIVQNMMVHFTEVVENKMTNNAKRKIDKTKEIEGKTEEKAEEESEEENDEEEENQRVRRRMTSPAGKKTIRSLEMQLRTQRKLRKNE